MKEKILKDLKREAFIKKLETDKDAVSMTIAVALGLDIEFVEKNMVLDKDIIEKPYDLVVSITPNYIKIKTSKFNKKIQELPINDRFYNIFYDEKKQQYIIKISIIKAFEYYYDDVLEEEYNINSKEFNIDDKETLTDLELISTAISLIPPEELVNIRQELKKGNTQVRINIAV